MDNNRTQHFSVVKEELDVHMILERVYEALQEKGYNPVNQMVGYISLEIQHTLPVITMQEASSIKSSVTISLKHCLRTILRQD